MVDGRLLLQRRDEMLKGKFLKASSMSKFVTGVIGAAAVLASLGAAQFAIGGDLSGSTAQLAAAAQSNHVNRSVKADRQGGAVRNSIGMTVTQSSVGSEMSIATRTSPKSMLRDVKSFAQVRPIACEAPASVLTDIAKRMESGRCVT